MQSCDYVLRKSIFEMVVFVAIQSPEGDDRAAHDTLYEMVFNTVKILAKVAGSRMLAGKIAGS